MFASACEESEREREVGSVWRECCVRWCVCQRERERERELQRLCMFENCVFSLALSLSHGHILSLYHAIALTNVWHNRDSQGPRTLRFKISFFSLSSHLVESGLSPQNNAAAARVQLGGVLAFCRTGNGIFRKK